MTIQTAGIHHITAFAGDPQANVDFYAGVLGLRLVKKTINFDAPDVYHLYFGDEHGSPGTIITFFPSAGSPRGKIGGGQVGITSYVIPPGSIGFWQNRLEQYNIEVTKTSRFNEDLLQFEDGEGLRLELVEREEGATSTWAHEGIPTDKAIKGFGGAVLFSVNPQRTMDALEKILGFVRVSENEEYARFRSSGDIGNVVDVPVTRMALGMGGAGTVHHIAWRATDDEEHAQWSEAVRDYGYQPTPVRDRQYFNAIYFREAGGILFEIATDPPGFAKDEPADLLGQKLMLPEWFEKYRPQIEDNLQPIVVRTLVPATAAN
ncbi:ring-cleaving dioxygenase [Paenibacillus sp. FSL H7-689]|uniref:ring-cleaving dioxygenase n=1 Tax=Paenibacillus sp. FSL H7-689 TaxID=1227349 RepID=UPI0003E2BE16|nr:ring-cleaving dioxygenase [Paenibacillus sp. FSL H7-689]ETT43081.1 lactoylglutathione lyase [Paenibacillus sp. FSL H7-689]